MSRLNYFLEIFEKDIAEAYQLHEKTFDIESFHGRFHILRCLFLINKLDEYYKLQPVDYDIDSVYYAILFHDIARKNNGIDIWESDSANLCYQYLMRKGFGRDKSYNISQLILKKKPFSLEGQMVYDVDVLDYFRFFWLPYEKDLFEENRLIVGGKMDIINKENPIFRKLMIDYTQGLVKITDEISVDTATSELIHKIKTSMNQISLY